VLETKNNTIRMVSSNYKTHIQKNKLKKKDMGVVVKMTD